MDNAKAPQDAEISTAQRHLIKLGAIDLGAIDLGKATKETRGCLGVVNDFICFMPLSGPSRD